MCIEKVVKDDVIPQASRDSRGTSGWREDSEVAEHAKRFFADVDFQ